MSLGGAGSSIIRQLSEAKRTLASQPRRPIYEFTSSKRGIPGYSRDCPQGCARPTKFEFVLNLRTVKTLGLKTPDKLLALADEVIE
jgi:hypothetical protein